MKILSTENIRALDAYTIENKPICSIDLMEKASQTFIKYFTKKYSKKKNIAIFCGTGNNGGDGLAVSRLLLQKKYKVKTFILEFSKNYSKDFTSNLNRLQKVCNANIEFIRENKTLDFSEFDIIIDSILGSGISRPISGFAKETILKINKSNLPIIAIDIPSGLACDKKIEGEKIKATSTLSFELPKLSFLLPENEKFVGDWFSKSIGLSKSFIANCETTFYFTDKKVVKNLIKNRSKFSHKGNNGHSLIVSGKIGSIGASVLSTHACVASGSGLTTAHVPKCGLDILQISIPEAMVSIDENETKITKIISQKKVNAIGIGPGLGTDADTEIALSNLLKSTNFPIVMDADALNIISENKELLEITPKNSILTPHPKEFERLVGNWKDDYEKLDLLRQFSVNHQLIVVLKGTYTAIALPNSEIHFNSTGNSALSTGGSGDVLTGIITGLLAQNYRPEHASILGVYLHGLAADIHQQKVKSQRMKATKIIENLGKAFENILSK